MLCIFYESKLTWKDLSTQRGIKQTRRNECLRSEESQSEFGAAEDLTQDELLKVHRAIEVNPQREISKAFLFRVTSNTWKDNWKRTKGHWATLSYSVPDATAQDGELSTRELLEELAHRLSPRSTCYSEMCSISRPKRRLSSYRLPKRPYRLRLVGLGLGCVKSPCNRRWKGCRKKRAVSRSSGNRTISTSWWTLFADETRSPYAKPIWDLRSNGYGLAGCSGQMASSPFILQIRTETGLW